mmetsp:Transcript_11392/g.25849  ORF Transcript_11392/g.25849 Transcript_11392/m.25849 type:complete len:307 (-) Transcript_11392:125-1045(-)
MASLTRPLTRLPEVLASRYDLGHNIGTGSYARVYQVCNRGSGKKFALKVVDKAPLEARSISDMLEKEARFLQDLVGVPSIVQLLEVYDAHDRFFMIFELCERNLMDLPKAVDEEVALLWLREACLGVKELHDRGIIHRDLKPGNLLLTEDGGVRICDFGFACHAEEVPKGMTGSRCYAAPEQQWDDVIQTTKVDIYSLGMCLRHFGLGRMPIGPEDHAPTASEEVLELLRDMNDPIPEMRPTVDDVLSRPVMQNLPADSVPSDCLVPMCGGRAEGSFAGFMSQVLAKTLCCTHALQVVHDEEVLTF